MVDIDKRAITQVYKNMKALKIEDKCHPFVTKAEVAIKVLGKKQKVFDVIFLDPPYYTEDYNGIISKIHSNKLLSPTGFLVIEHSKRSKFEVEDMQVLYRKSYGDTILTFCKER